MTRQRMFIAVLGLALFAFACAFLRISAEPAGPDEPLRLFGLWRLRHVAIFLLVGGTGLSLLLYAASRATLLYLTIVVATLSVLMASLEAAGRAGIVDWVAILSPKAGDLDDLATKAVPYRQAEGVTYQDTAFRLGLESPAIPFSFSADRHGFRNPEDRDSADIILLGDSMLVGALVDAEKTVSARLDALLPDSVMQVALIGIGLQQQHHLLRDSGIDVSGRTVVQFVFEGNDLLDSRTHRNAGQAPTDQPPNSLFFGLWNIATRATGRSDDPASFDSCRIDDTLYTFLWTDRSFKDHLSEIGPVKEAISAFAEEMAQRGANFHLVYVPTKFRVLADLCSFPDGSRLGNIPDHLSPLREDMRSWAQDAGIDLLDLTIPLQAAARAGSIPWFWGDTHWNEIGHTVVADHLAQWPALSD